ncbi:metallophosphoesterase [Lederbergia citrea]|uniref:metallophosphoesterase n=1 Tax=Lederbergia citrea TaxID=2833581 RepID=UPI0020163319|nr:metallophosphoesterase [Lederbergia citrea]
MGDEMRKIKAIFALLLTVMAMPIGLNRTHAQEVPKSVIDLQILETTDLHAKIMDYDYVNRKHTVKYGLIRTATLIKESRKTAQNSLLFDVGDVLVGNSLGKYALKTQYVNFMDIHPVIKAMNILNYDAATIGNHEFNYGLEFLNKSLQGANFPYVNANIYIDDHNDFEGDDLNYFKPYTIIKKEVKDSVGKKHLLKIGVIGLITPIVADWDEAVFQGKLKVKNIRATAEYYVPIMKEHGADIIVALAHTGMEPDRGLKQKNGNSVYSLSKVKGIDAILYGHSHSLFPLKGDHSKKKGIDQNKGTVNGVATVQAGYWGNHLGIIDLQLVNKNGKWKVKNSQSSVKSIYRTINRKKIPTVPRDPEIEKIIETDHRILMDYMKMNFTHKKSPF